MKEREALNIAIDYMNERLEEHDAKYQRHPATEAERNNILTDIETVKEALMSQSDGAQPEQEPVAWANRVVGGRKWLSIHASKGASERWLEYRTKEQAQGEEYEQIALYTTPPQRTWVHATEWRGLTDEEMRKIAYNTAERKVAKDIEAKLKEKNDC